MNKVGYNLQGSRTTLFCFLLPITIPKVVKIRARIWIQPIVSFKKTTPPVIAAKGIPFKNIAVLLAPNCLIPSFQPNVPKAVAPQADNNKISTAVDDK